MSEFTDKLKEVEKLIRNSKDHDEYKNCHDLYGFLEISDKTTSLDNIQSRIAEKAKHFQGLQSNSKWGELAVRFNKTRSAIEYMLIDHRSAYDNYLIDLKAAELRKHFISRTRDKLLDSKEKDDLILEGIAIGLYEPQINALIDRWMVEDGVKPVEYQTPSSGPIPFDELLGKTYYEIFGISRDADYSEIKNVYDAEYKKYNKVNDKKRATARWVLISEGWEILQDKDKRREYDETLDKPPEVDDRLPILKVSYKLGGYIYNNVRKGSEYNETIVIKNGLGGQLKGKILSNVNWLVPERDNLTYKHEQSLQIRVITSKIPNNSFDSSGCITIDTNGGPPQIIPFRVILEGLDIASERFRKTYVPLIAAFAGFICSFNSSPILNYLCGAALFGGIAYASSKIAVQYFLNEGIDIFQPPPVLIQTGAACVFILTIMLHSGGGNQNNVQPNIQAPPAEAPVAAAPAAPAAAAPAAPAAEAPAAAPAAEVQTTRTIDNIVYNNFIPSGSRVQIWAVENGRLGREISVQSWRQENGILHVTLAEDIPMGLMVQEKITPLNPQRNTSREDQQELERREENVRRNAMRDRQEQERRDNAVRDRQELEQERRNNAMRDRQEQERRDNAVRDRQEQRRSYDIRHNAMRDLRDRQEQERRDKNRERYPLQRTENASSRRNSLMNDLQ